jgi:hypothetical protein
MDFCVVFDSIWVENSHAVSAMQRFSAVALEGTEIGDSGEVQP